MPPLADVTGVRVLLTGGTSGLGLAMATALAEGGARVVLTGRDQSRAEAAAAAASSGRPGRRPPPGEAVGLALDVRDADAVRAGVARATETLGGLDVLVNNAGIGMRTVNPEFLEHPQPFYQVPPEGFRDLFETNVTGYFLVARAVVPAMVAARRGTVVNVSVNEATMRRAGFVPYGPSRAASEALSRVMAADLAGTGVNVHLLLPGGATATGMIPEGLTEERRAALLPPSVMGPAIRWLCSPESARHTDLRVVASGFLPARYAGRP